MKGSTNDTFNRDWAAAFSDNDKAGPFKLRTSIGLPSVEIIANLSFLEDTHSPPSAITDFY